MRIAVRVGKGRAVSVDVGCAGRAPEGSGTTDLELVRAYGREGDESALATLLARHWERAFRLALRVLRDPAAAEDCAQEVFARLALGARRAAEPAAFLPWFHALVLNAARNAARGRKRRAAHEGRAWASAGPVLVARNEAAREAAALAAELEGHLEALPTDLRLAIHLHYGEGRKLDEIAMAFGIPAGTASSRVRRGLEKLRGSLARAGFAGVSAGALAAGLHALERGHLAQAQAALPGVPTTGSVHAIAAALPVAFAAKVAGVSVFAAAALATFLVIDRVLPATRRTAPPPAAVVANVPEPERIVPPEAVAVAGGAAEIIADVVDAAPSPASPGERTPPPKKELSRAQPEAKPAPAAEEKDAWILHESKSWRIKTNLDAEWAKYYGRFLDELSEQHARVPPSPPAAKKKRDAVIFQSLAEYDAFCATHRITDARHGSHHQRKSPVPGWSADDSVVAAHAWFGPGDGRTALARAATIQRLRECFVGTDSEYALRPMWLRVGLTTYFGEGFRLDDRGEGAIGVPLHRLEAAIGEAPAEPRADSTQAWPETPELLARSATPNWAFTHYALQGAGKDASVVVDGVSFRVDVRAAFWGLIEECAPRPEIRTWPEAPADYVRRFERSLGVPVSALGSDLARHLSTLAPAEQLDLDWTLPHGWAGDLGRRRSIRNEATGATIRIQVEERPAVGEAETAVAIRELVKGSLAWRYADLRMVSDGSRSLGSGSADLVFEGTEREVFPGIAPSPVRQTVWIIIRADSGVKRRVYQLIYSAPSERYEQGRAAFEEVARRLRLR